MTGELFAKVIIDNEERKEIEKAINIMENVAEAYRKTGVESAQFLVEDLNDGISALNGVLEGMYF